MPGSIDSRYDAVIVVGFGGPEAPDEVMPFLREVTRGRGIPDVRLEAVAAHYHHFGGVSPINEQTRRIRDHLEAELDGRGVDLAVFWGNRNWRPWLTDAVAEMTKAGVSRALAVVTSAYSSYSSCRQYLEAIAAAREVVGVDAPEIDKIRAYHDHPGFVLPLVDEVAAARARLAEDLRRSARLVFTAHSVPLAMAESSDYVSQLEETAGLVADRSGFSGWDLVWQSRSGPPSVPWLEPDINDHLREIAGSVRAVVLAPIGFVTDNMEIVWDLDVEAAATAGEIGLTIERAVTPGTGPDPRFVSMLADLVTERLVPDRPRISLGAAGPRPDRCPDDCCPRPSR